MECERQGYRNPYEFIIDFTEEKIFFEFKRQDYDSLQELKKQRKGNVGTKNPKDSRAHTKRTGSNETNIEIREAGLNNSAFSNGEKYSLDIDSNKKITVDMSDSDRAAILKNSNIDICNVSNTSVLGIDFDNLENNIKSAVEKDLLKKLNELGFLKKYRSSAIDVQFELTGKGIRKSLNSQENSYGGSKADFAKAILNIEKLLDNALLIETHTDKGKGTQRENRRLKQVYVLMSAMQDGRYIIPVQFEVKQYVDDNNRLYLAVALTKIETGVMVHTAFETQMRTGLLPISNIVYLSCSLKSTLKTKIS